jgi:hypothetical protein
LGWLLPICDRIGGCVLQREFGKKIGPVLTPTQDPFLVPRSYPALFVAGTIVIFGIYRIYPAQGFFSRTSPLPRASPMLVR